MKSQQKGSSRKGGGKLRRWGHKRRKKIYRRVGKCQKKEVM